MNQAQKNQLSQLESLAISKSPFEKIQNTLQLTVTEGVDDLGKFKWAESIIGEQAFAIRRYLQSPEPSVEFMLPPSTAKTTLLAVLDRLGDKADNLYWRHPKAGGKLRRQIVNTLNQELSIESPLMQILMGPRQVGKTTAVQHLSREWSGDTHYISADEVVNPSDAWLHMHWQEAVSMGEGTLLVIDEIQKVWDWTLKVKELWDKTKNTGIRVVLLGSNSIKEMLAQSSKVESLAGRFRRHLVSHWSYAESREAFGMNLENYLTFGGYPRASEMVGDLDEWISYMGGSLINPIIEGDIMQTKHFKSSRSLRRAFEVLCDTSAPTSYRKLVEQVGYGGNTETVQTYIQAFEDVFLLERVENYVPHSLKKRRANPKILTACPAIYSFGNRNYRHVDSDPVRFEQSVGMELNRLHDIDLDYWREGKASVDYVIRTKTGDSYGVIAKSSDRIVQKLRGAEKIAKVMPKIKVAFVTPENFEKFSWNPMGFLSKYAI